MIAYEFGYATDAGLVRLRNEDAFAILPEAGIAVVADGLGGHGAGDVASLIVVEKISTELRHGVPIPEAIASAHFALLTAPGEGRGSPGMGSTVVAVRLDGDAYEIGWVGDSRAYLWYGELRQLTRDHSLVQEWVDAGVLTPREAREHPYRHLVTRVLGSDDRELVVDTVAGRVTPGARLLLCTDGLTGEVDDHRIAVLLGLGLGAQATAELLVTEAIARGGADNITAVVLVALQQLPVTSLE